MLDMENLMKIFNIAFKLYGVVFQEYTVYLLPLKED